MHCSVSGCGDILAETEEDAIKSARRYLSYFPPNYTEKAPVIEAKPARPFDRPLEEIIPKNQNAPFQMMDLIDRIIDEASFYEIKKNCSRQS